MTNCWADYVTDYMYEPFDIKPSFNMLEKLESLGDLRMANQRETLVPRLRYKRQVGGRGGFNRVVTLKSMSDFPRAELKPFSDLEKIELKDQEALVRRLNYKRQSGRPDWSGLVAPLESKKDFRAAEFKSFGDLKKTEKREALIRKIRCKRQGGRPGCGAGLV